MLPKTLEEIRAEIDATTTTYQHVLDAGPATVDINAPRAIMQMSARTKLDILYWVLGEERPRFTCDDRTKLNH